MIKIKYVPEENCVAELGNKQAICKRFEGIKIKTLNALLTEMSNTPEFQNFVINPTQKIVMINFEGFLMFLRYRQEHRYKRSA